MDRISLYIFRHLAVATTIATLGLSFAIWLTQSLRLIEVIVDGQAPMTIFVQLVVLSLPNFLIVVLPVAAVGATLFVYNRLLIDSELIVMRSSGMGPARLAWPAFALAILVAGLIYVLNLLVAPAANQQFRSLQNLIKSEYSTAFLREGQFNTVADGITVYFRERERSGELSGILVHDNRAPERPVTLVAEQGILTETDAGPRVVMFEGNRQEADRATNRINVLYFDQYALDLEALEPRAAKPRWVEPKERYIGDLLAPNPNDPNDVEMRARLVSMAHQRLSSPLMALGFAGIAMGALLSGEFNRRGQGGRMILAIAGIVLLQAFVMGISSASREIPGLLPLLYLAPLLALIAGVAMMHRHLRRRRAGALQALPAA